MKKQPPLTILDGIQILAGAMFLIALGICVYAWIPEVKAEVDATWVKGKARWYELRNDFRGFYSLSAEKLIDRGQEARSNELKGLMLLDRTKACEKGDADACREIGQSAPKASKCPPEVTACASYEKYEAKWKKSS